MINFAKINRKVKKIIMENQATDKLWKKNGTEWGAKCGALAAAFTMGLYFFSKDWLLSKWLLIGINAIFIWGIFQVQKNIKSLELKPYIQPGFLVFVVGNAIFYIFYHILFAYIDPGLVDLQASIMEASGTVKEVFSVEDLKPSLKNTFDNYIRSLITGFILASIMGFVFKYQRGNK